MADVLMNIVGVKKQKEIFFNTEHNLQTPLKLRITKILNSRIVDTLCGIKEQTQIDSLVV